MSLVRRIVALLLLAALPLQGLAAASMLFCGPAAVAAEAAPAAIAGVHHGHGHAGPLDDGGASGAHHGQHAQAAPGQPDGASDATHDCPICASGCQLVAIAQDPAAPGVLSSPSAALEQPRVPLLTRVSPRPDKPPRA